MKSYTPAQPAMPAIEGRGDSTGLLSGRPSSEGGSTMPWAAVEDRQHGSEHGVTFLAWYHIPLGGAGPIRAWATGEMSPPR